MMKGILLTIVVYLCLGTLVFAQGGATGAITGTAQDSSGAVIAGATVRIINQDTDVLSRTTKTGANGLFTATLLPVGIYTVTINSAGFQEGKFADITVRITETTRMIAKLRPLTVLEKVEVFAEVQTVETTTPVTGQSVGSKTIEALPLPTRNVQQLLSLSTGTSTDLTASGQLGRGDVRMNVNGQREGNNNFLIEGVSASDYNVGELTNTPLPSPDALQEFKVQTSLYDATQGRAGGGNINAILKGGTKTFHGSLFEFFRSDVLNANEFFFKRGGQPRPVVKQNIFGGSLGGPLGHDGALGFFFLNYQGTRQRSGLSPGTFISTNLPILPQDRSATSLLNTFFPGQSGVQIDPVTLALLNFKSNQFGGSGGGFLFPSLPGTPGFDTVNGNINTAPFNFSRPGKFTDDQFTVNWDRSFNGGRDLVAERFFFSNFSSFLPFGATGLASAFGASISPTDIGFPLSLPVRNRFLSLAEVHTFGPRLINELRFGWVHIANDTNNVPVVSLNDLGISRPNSNVDTNIYRFQFAQGGFQMGPTPADNVSQQQNNFSILDTISYNLGHHQLRFGGEVNRVNMDKNFPQLFNGLVVFAPTPPDPTVPNDPCALSPIGFCSDFQNFLRGFPVVSGSGSGVTNHEYRINAFALFLQDDFKATSNLTLNLGLRWELDGAVSDKLHHIANLDPSLVAKGQAPWIFPRGVSKLNVPGLVGTGSDTLTDNGYAFNWGPRIGFAYDVLGRHTTAIRGGYGIYYEREDNGAVDNLGFSSPFLAGSFGPGAPGSLANLPAFSILPPAGTISPDFVPSLSHFLGFADCGLADITQCSPNFDGNSIFLIALQTPRHYVSPNVQQWNLTLQRQLPLKWLMEIGYVGTKGTHLRETRTTIQPFLVSPQNPITLTANGQTFQITQNSVANAPARSRVLGLGPSGMQFFGNDADSHYHSLQATVSRRMDRIYLQGAYTFSKAIDDNSSDATAFNTAINDQTNLRASRGLSDFDRTHRFVVSYSYDLTFFATATGLEKALLGGWVVSGVTTFQSGKPFTVIDTTGGTAFTPIGPGQSTASLQPGKTIADGLTHGSVESRLGAYLDSSAFATAPVVGPDGSTGYGNLPRNPYRGPFQQNWDFALGKTFSITEAQKLEFRTEFFNIWNHPSFNSPLFVDISGPNFGAITTTVGTPRLIQLVARYSF